MQEPLSQELKELITRTLAGDKFAFKRLIAVIYIPEIGFFKRAQLLEAMPAQLLLNHYAKTVRAIVLLQDVPGKSQANVDEGLALLKSAADERNSVAMLERGLLLWLDETLSPALRHEGILLLKAAARSGDEETLFQFNQLFPDLHANNFQTVIDRLEAVDEPYKPTGMNP